MVALFAIFVIVGAGVKKAIADSKAKSDITTVVVSDDESSNANTFGAFDSLKNSQIIAPEGYVSINKPTSTTETTLPTSEETEILSNDRASPNTLDSS